MVNPKNPIEVPTEFEPATAFDPEDPAPRTPFYRIYLLVREGGGVRVVDVADGQRILFGRLADAHVRVDDAKASRRHAELSRNGRELVLLDLGSRNGTKLNGKRLRNESQVVNRGDVIQIGGCETIVATAEGGGELEGEIHRGRLDRELSRVLATTGARATLVRIGVDLEQHADVMSSLTSALGSMAVVEERGEGEYAALLEESDPQVVEKLLGKIRETEGVELTVVRIPEHGRTASDLWARTRAGASATVVRDATEGVIVADASMVEVFSLARKLAAVQTTVLILGETGVGKEVIAGQIHRWSARSKAPFVRLNCASLPETLLESELFGHERGAFTGADRRKIGYLEASQGGTLFLDEIGELPVTVQVKLLNVLENREVRRLGGTQEYPIDVRVVSATHRDLQGEVKSGRFREDLYYRLSAFTLNVPPLRERQAEIALLAEMFARESSRRAGRTAPVFDAAALSVLGRYPWPGNVRELRNAMEHAVVLADAGRIGVEHLPDSIRRGEAMALGASRGSVRDRLADLEKKSIEEALGAEGGNQTRAARRLGLSRRALIYKLEKYGIKK